MGAMEATYHVRFERRQFDVSVDQRDWAAMEAQDFPASAGVLATRYMVYNAARRAGLYNGAWDRFNKTDCLSVDLVEPDAAAADDDPDDPDAGADPDESGDEQGPDPTTSTPGPTDQSADSTSRSPARRGSRSRK